MKKLFMALAALLVMAIASPASALNDGRIKIFATDALRTAATTQKDGTIAYAHDTDDFKYRAGGSWTAISTGTTFTGANAGTIANGTNYLWSLSAKNDAAATETISFDFTTANVVTLSSTTGVATLITALDLTLGGGAAAITFTDSASSIVVPANDTTALLIGPAAQPGLITIDSGTATETVHINGTTTVLAFEVTTGLASFAEATTLASGAGALTFTSASASILVKDNEAAGLSIGAAGITDAMVLDSRTGAENIIYSIGLIEGTTSIAGVVTLDASDCGKTHFVTAAATGDDIDLPATIAGCELTFMYVGADSSCLVDLSPDASDAVHGSCTLAASVLEFSGADDADIGLTSATSNTGDTITLMGDGAEGWYVTTCTGIWANN